MAYRILVADDEKEIRDLLRLYLEKDGYQVAEASDGGEAWALLEKGEVDMALLDIMMPRMDGYKVLKKLRETSNIPVMILSAKNQDTDKILGLDLGADDYLAKPFNPMEAVARINSNIRRFYSLGARSGELKQLVVRDLRLDTEACVVYKREEPWNISCCGFLWNIRERCIQSSRYMKMCGARNMPLQTTILWCVSAASGQSCQRTAEPILRPYGALDIGWRNKHETCDMEMVCNPAVSADSAASDPQRKDVEFSL